MLLHPHVILCSPPTSHDERKIRSLQALACGEQVGNVGAGFDSLQREFPLHAETLASLCAASTKHGTTTLGGHASTKAVALRALAVVRLVGAFHLPFPFIIKE